VFDIAYFASDDEDLESAVRQLHKRANNKTLMETQLRLMRLHFSFLSSEPLQKPYHQKFKRPTKSYLDHKNAALDTQLPTRPSTAKRAVTRMNKSAAANIAQRPYSAIGRLSQKALTQALTRPRAVFSFGYRDRFASHSSQCSAPLYSHTMNGIRTRFRGNNSVRYRRAHRFPESVSLAARRVSPGPGHYLPGIPKHVSMKCFRGTPIPSYAFHSTTYRMFHKAALHHLGSFEENNRGPGTYNPNHDPFRKVKGDACFSTKRGRTHTTTAYASKRYYNKHAKKQMHNKYCISEKEEDEDEDEFDSDEGGDKKRRQMLRKRRRDYRKKQERILDWESDQAPGPGHYSPSITEVTARIPVFRYRWSAPRGLSTQLTENALSTPGPGYYLNDTKERVTTLLDKAMGGNTTGGFSKTPRFRYGQQTAAHRAQRGTREEECTYTFSKQHFTDIIQRNKENMKSHTKAQRAKRHREIFAAQRKRTSQAKVMRAKLAHQKMLAAQVSKVRRAKILLLARRKQQMWFTALVLVSRLNVMQHRQKMYQLALYRRFARQVLSQTWRGFLLNPKFRRKRKTFGGMVKKHSMLIRMHSDLARKRKAVDLIVKFFRDCSKFHRTNMSGVIKRAQIKVIRIQRFWRKYLAKIYSQVRLVLLQWIRLEINSSWLRPYLMKKYNITQVDIGNRAKLRIEQQSVAARVPKPARRDSAIKGLGKYMAKISKEERKQKEKKQSQHGREASHGRSPHRSTSSPGKSRQGPKSTGKKGAIAGLRRLPRLGANTRSPRSQTDSYSSTRSIPRSQSSSRARSHRMQPVSRMQSRNNIFHEDARRRRVSYGTVPSISTMRSSRPVKRKVPYMLPLFGQVEKKKARRGRSTHSIVEMEGTVPYETRRRRASS